MRRAHTALDTANKKWGENPGSDEHREAVDKALVVVKHSVAAYNVVKQKYAGSSRKRAGWVLMAWGRRNAATKAAAALALAAACAASRAKEALDAVDAAPSAAPPPPSSISTVRQRRPAHQPLSST